MNGNLQNWKRSMFKLAKEALAYLFGKRNKQKTTSSIELILFQMTVLKDGY